MSFSFLRRSPPPATFLLLLATACRGGGSERYAPPDEGEAESEAESEAEAEAESEGEPDGGARPDARPTADLGVPCEQDPRAGTTCAAGVGACAAEGTWGCNADGDLACDAIPGDPGFESCANRGVDDDCDGDDQDVADTGAPCATNLPGACADGSIQCAPDGLNLACLPLTPPSAETCANPGVDDDCDGDDQDVEAPENEHLLLSEVVVGPSGGEFIEVYNPLAEVVDLSGYGLADFNTYWQAPIERPGDDSVAGSDWIVRFPTGATLAPCARATVALNGAAAFSLAYGAAPTFEIRAAAEPDDPAVPDMAADLGDAPGGSRGLTDAGEMVMLFALGEDGVRDVDYVTWGTTPLARVDKTGVPGYRPDTPQDAQAAARAPDPRESLARCGNGETGEIAEDGNGVTGHDETSEELGVSWLIASAPTPGAPEPACAGAATGCEASATVGTACARGVGGCLGLGLWRCAQGAHRICDAVAGEPAAETCGDVGRDDDCDGDAGEIDGLDQPCQTGAAGACAEGRTACDQGEPACAALRAPAAETCTDAGRDDDCDGDPDDVDGAGEACDTGLAGACGPGRTACGGDALACVATDPGRPETCGNLGSDDDCDGDTADVDGAGEPCEVAGALGECARGERRCDGPTLACAATTEAEPETCANLGADDDCDGVPDNDLPGPETCADVGTDNDCDGDPDDVDGLGEPCTSALPGVCAPGTRRCLGGSLQCVPDVAPGGAETCNDLGVDNNCDGDPADVDTDLAGHVLLSEVGVCGIGEFVELFNPTAATVELSGYALADFATYWQAPVDAAAPDFLVRFPAGATLAPCARATVAVTGAGNFTSYWGSRGFPGLAPSFEIVGAGQTGNDMVPDMVADLGDTPGGSRGLTDAGELVILFRLGGGGAPHRDGDYVTWGNDLAERVDKTGAVGYQPDTPAAQQSPAPTSGCPAGPPAAASLIRCSLTEAGERGVGGNGVEGDDETSEPLGANWRATTTPSPGGANACP